MAVTYEVGLVDYLRRLFGFLSDVYGCAELPPLENKELRLANRSTLVVIKSEREGPWVGLDRAVEPRDLKHGALPLWVIMAIRESKYSISRPVPAIDKFVDLAQAIPECAADVLHGDFSIEAEVQRFCENKAKEQREWEHRLHFDFALARADEAFRKQDFAGVIRHLLPYEAELSPAQKSKLAYARRRLPADS